MSMKIINLNLADHVLTGKYTKDDDAVLVVLDTSQSTPFSVTLPDLYVSGDKEFLFKNIPHGETGADVTIQTVNNQKIDGEHLSQTVSPYGILSLVSNKLDTWVLMESGPVSGVQNPVYLGRNGIPLWRLMVNSVGALVLDFDTFAGAAASPVWSDEYEKWDGRGTFV